jgi:hypothetical protein
MGMPVIYIESPLDLTSAARHGEFRPQPATRLIPEPRVFAKTLTQRFGYLVFLKLCGARKGYAYDAKRSVCGRFIGGSLS